MLYNNKHGLKFLLIYNRCRNTINYRYLRCSNILQIRKAASSTKVAYSSHELRNPNVSEVFQAAKSTYDNHKNFYGIEGDEGVIHVQKADSTETSIQYPCKTMQQPKSEFRSVSFGAVRLDSENKPLYYIRYNDSNNCKIALKKIADGVEKGNSKLDSDHDIKNNVTDKFLETVEHNLKTDTNNSHQSALNIDSQNTIQIKTATTKDNEVKNHVLMPDSMTNETPKDIKLDSMQTQDRTILKTNNPSESFIDNIYFAENVTYKANNSDYNHQNSDFILNENFSEISKNLELNCMNQSNPSKTNKQSKNFIENLYFSENISTNTSDLNIEKNIIEPESFYNNNIIQNKADSIDKITEDKTCSQTFLSPKPISLSTNAYNTLKPKQVSTSYIDNHCFEENIFESAEEKNNPNYIDQQYFDIDEFDHNIESDVSNESNMHHKSHITYKGNKNDLGDFQNLKYDKDADNECESEGNNTVDKIDKILLAKVGVQKETDFKLKDKILNKSNMSQNNFYKNKFLFGTHKMLDIDINRIHSSNTKSDSTKQSFQTTNQTKDQSSFNSTKLKEKTNFTIETGISNDQNESESAYSYVQKLREKQNMLDLVKKGISSRKEKKLDSKGFKILKHQVPTLKYFTRDEMLELLKENILYSDDDIVVLNKPYNLVMHESSTSEDAACLSMYLKDLAEILDQTSKSPNLFTVHRLDKETTGCLILARNETAAQKMKSLFFQRKIIKTYWIVTSRVPDPVKGVIDIPISEGRIEKKQRMVLNPDLPDDVPYKNHSKSGKRAVTSYSVVATSGNAALVEVKPETGIKHQIRVHFGFGLACPILGDHKYSHLDKLAPQKLPSDILQKLHVRQSKVRHIPLHIHSKHILIPQYLNENNLFITAPLPKHMVENLRSLKFKK